MKNILIGYSKKRELQMMQLKKHVLKKNMEIYKVFLQVQKIKVKLLSQK
jgi:hypothetical protein